MSRAAAGTYRPGRRDLLPGALLLAIPMIALPLGVAAAPVPTAILSLVAAGGIVAFRELGARMMLWLLFVATIPLREPLAIDVLGTKSIYLNDVFLLPVAVVTLHENGIRPIWRKSPAFRLGLLLTALGLVGLYNTSKWTFTVNQSYRSLMEAAMFYVAWHFIRDPRRARWTLFAFLAGMIPATVYGIHQSTLPIEALVAPDGSVPARTWDENGVPHVRTASTFWNALAFSLASTVAFGICLGLLVRARTAWRRISAAALALLFLWGNQISYSVGGLIASAAAVGAAALVVGRRYVFIVVPAAALLWLALAPSTFVFRINQIVTGNHTSYAIRIVGYMQALEIFRDHPVIGVGWGNIGEEMTGEYRITRTHGLGAPEAAENYFLQHAMALGSVGLVTVMILGVLFARNVLSRPPPGWSDPRGEWPRAALIIAGAGLYVQMQAQPSVDAVSGYILWILFPIAERMRMAFRGES